MYVQLSNPSGAALEFFATYGFGTIYDDDAPGPGELRFSSFNPTVGENDDSIAIDVERAGGLTGAVSVHYSTVDGSATTGEDYTASSGTLSWADGDTTSRTITVAILPDTTFEGLEDFTLTLDNPTGGASLGFRATTTVTIIDDEADQPPVADAGPAASGAEGSLFQLDGSASDVENPFPSVFWSAARGVGTDPGATCFFTPANSADPQVACTDDGDYLLTISVSDGANPPVSDSTTLTLTNADPTIDISQPVPDASFVFGTPVQLSAAIGDPGSNDTHTCSIDWDDGTTEPGTVTFGACSGSHTYAAAGAYTIVVVVNDDDGGTASDTVDITVDEAPPSVSIDEVSHPEGNTGTTPFVFTVSLSAPSAHPITVDYTVGDGTATVADNDYIDGVGTLTFVAGDTSETITVAVVGDRTIEPDETFSVGLASAAATIADGTGLGTITNDDVPNPSPVVDAGTAPTGFAEGAAVPLAGSATDTEPLTILWSATAGSVVDGLASCTFADPTHPATSVSCTDDGTWTLTLTADDGTNPPVTDTTTLTLANVDPTVDIGLPVSGASFAFGTAVQLSATIGDAGSNDTHICSIDWNDGTTAPGSVSAGACTGTHTYAAPGSYTITVTATDDDGGTGSDTVAITIRDVPPPAPSLSIDDQAHSEGDSRHDAVHLHGHARPRQRRPGHGPLGESRRDRDRGERRLRVREW